MLEESKPSVKRRYSNASQSSHEFSDSEKSKEKRPNKSKNTEDAFNSGSVVGIDWLFESGDCAIDPWTSKSKFSATEVFFLDKSTSKKNKKTEKSSGHMSLYASLYILCYVFLIRAASILDFRSL